VSSSNAAIRFGGARAAARLRPLALAAVAPAAELRVTERDAELVTLIAAFRLLERAAELRAAVRCEERGRAGVPPSAPSSALPPRRAIVLRTLLAF